LKTDLQGQGRRFLRIFFIAADDYSDDANWEFTISSP